MAYSKLVPFKVTGKCDLATATGPKRFAFDSRNAQFVALYSPVFAAGYELEVGALLDLLLPDDGVFYDIGSNWGYFALFVASRPGFRGEIHAFEPFPRSFADLKELVTQTGFGDRIRCHNVALSDRDGLASMCLPDFTNSGLAVVEEAKADSAQRGDIKMTSLDELQAPAPAVIKMDVEGMEAIVLRGGQKLLKQQCPTLVFENTRSFENPKQTLDPLFMLEELGYKFFQPAWQQADGHFLGGDFQFHSRPGTQFQSTRLALVRFEPKERFLHQHQINVLACHDTRLAGLESMFKDSTR